MRGLADPRRGLPGRRCPRAARHGDKELGAKPGTTPPTPVGEETRGCWRKEEGPGVFTGDAASGKPTCLWVGISQLGGCVITRAEDSVCLGDAWVRRTPGLALRTCGFRFASSNYTNFLQSKPPHILHGVPPQGPPGRSAFCNLERAASSLPVRLGSVLRYLLTPLGLKFSSLKRPV